MWDNLSIVVIQFVTKEQQKKIIFEFHVTSYGEDTFSYVLTSKYMCHFGLSSEEINL
jgi:hypothetical protein